SVGSDIGMCLRVANYSKVGAATRETIGRVVRDVAGELGAGLMPLIVSDHGAEDRHSTLPLLEGYDRRSSPIRRFGTADQLAKQVSGCRALVTSTYHVAVFALSQGIPVVGLSTSAYYDDKFHGLAEMFGTGLTVVQLDDEGLDTVLAQA